MLESRKRQSGEVKSSSPWEWIDIFCTTSWSAACKSGSMFKRSTFNVQPPKRRKDLPLICTNLSFNTEAIRQQKPRTMMSLCHQRGKPTLPTSKPHREPSTLSLAAERRALELQIQPITWGIRWWQVPLGILPVGRRKAEFWVELYRR